jgi:hypothetical protein
MPANITYGTFLFFGSMTVLAAIWVFLCLPETKGVPLEEMDYLWATKTLATSNRWAYDEMKAIQSRGDAADAEKSVSISVEQKEVV